MRNSILNKILLDWRGLVKSGTPDVTDDTHLSKLFEVLGQHGWPGEARMEYIGNIVEQRFIDIWSSDRYWEVMNYLASTKFNAQKMCGTLCLQHKVNEFLDNRRKGQLMIKEDTGTVPQHVNFI